MASSAGVVVREIRALGDLDGAARLLWRVWGAGSVEARSQVISLSQLRALSHSGNYVAAAYRGGRQVGCAVGWFGADPGAARPSADHLHSHILGVDPREQARGVGFALKCHQRRWALDRGLARIRWTFDPLAFRNAWFNLRKLGATVAGIEPHFYGHLDDGLNTGVSSTDRLIVDWSLQSPRVVAAVAGKPFTGVEQARYLPDAELIWIPGGDGAVPGAGLPDLEGLRHAVRNRFLDLLELGYRVVGITGDGNYVLVPGDMSELADV